jgi:phage-related minor tail protein
MFQLTNEEFQILKSQFVTSSWGGIRRANPYAFTEQGIAMLSSILKSKKAVAVNIAIIRTFVHLRQLLAIHKYLADKLKEIEKLVQSHNGQIKSIFEVLKSLTALPEKPPRKIGF